MSELKATKKELTPELVSMREYLEEERRYFKDRVFYSRKHTWARLTPEFNVRVGLSEYALRRYLKDLAKIYCEKDGTTIRILEPFGVAETWMLMFDLYSPIAGKIVKVNNEAMENTENIDSATWLIEVHPLGHSALMKELEESMTLEEYGKYTASVEGRTE